MSRVILLRTELGVARFDLEFLDVDGGVVVVLHEALGNEDGVLEVVAAPRHEGHQNVAAEGQLAQLGAGAVGEHLAGVHLLPHAHDRLLVDAGVLVGPAELGQVVDVRAHLVRLVGVVRLALHANHDALRVHQIDQAAPPRRHDGAGIACRDVLHPGTDERGARPEQRHRLPLHVRSHERAVRVVVLEERNQRRRHRHELLRRHVDEVDPVARGQHEVAGLPGVDPLVYQVALVVESGVGLRDDVLVLLPGRQVERVRLAGGAPLLAVLRGRVLRRDLGCLDDVAGLVLRAAAVGDLHVVHGAPVLDLPVGRLDEAELVDARVARQRGDQADVRTLRRLDGTDAAVVGRMHVADLEPGALARQPARPERRQAAACA